MDAIATRRASRAARQTANGAGSAVSAEQGSNQKPTLFHEVSASLNFASIASLASADLTIAAPSGVTFRANAPVIVTPPSTIESGILTRGWVTAGGASVTVRATNVTGGAIDPAAGTYTALVAQ